MAPRPTFYLFSCSSDYLRVLHCGERVLNNIGLPCILDRCCFFLRCDDRHPRQVHGPYIGCGCRPLNLSRSMMASSPVVFMLTLVTVSKHYFPLTCLQVHQLTIACVSGLSPVVFFYCQKLCNNSVNFTTGYSPTLRYTHLLRVSFRCGSDTVHVIRTHGIVNPQGLTALISDDIRP